MSTFYVHHWKSKKLIWARLWRVHIGRLWRPKWRSIYPLAQISEPVYRTGTSVARAIALAQIVLSRGEGFKRRFQS